MRLVSIAPYWRATTGVAARPASWLRSGPSAFVAWSPSIVTTSRIFPVRPSRSRPSRSGDSGTNGISRLSAAARAWKTIVAHCAGCCGSYGRRTGNSMPQRLRAARYFVALTIHSYRHRYGNIAGDPKLEETEHRLAQKPKLTVPTIALQGDADGVLPPEASQRHAGFFTGPYQRHG